MADIAAAAPAADSGVSQVKDTARGQLTQLVGQMVETTGSQSVDIVTALEALAAVINAKPSA